MRKKMTAAILTAAMTAAMGITAFAGGWQEDSAGWRWQNDDGTYLADGWEWLDGNQDGVAECYCFGADGYMYASCVTPDNFVVNGEGQWVEGGMVQTQASGLEPGSSGSQTQTAEDAATKYDRENWLGEYAAEDGSTLTLGLGANGNFAGMYEDEDGDISMLDMKKVTDTKYKDSNKSKTMTLNEDGSVTINNTTFYM